MVNTPKFQALVLRGAFGGFRDDNFIAGWTIDGTNDGTFTAVNDASSANGAMGIVTLVNGIDNAKDSWKKTVPGTLSSNTYNRLIVRGRVSSGAGTLEVLVKNAASTIIATITITGTTYSIASATLTAAETIDRVFIAEQGGQSGRQVQIDWIYLVSDTHLDLTSKMRGYEFDDVLGWQTGECSVELQDEDGFFWKTTNILDPADIFMLYESLNDGITFFRVWGGPVRDLDKTSEVGNRVLTLRAHNWNKALESVVVFKFYGAQSDVSIVTDLIDTINTGFVVPTISGWNLAKDITGYTTVNMALNSIQGQEVVKLLTDVSNYTAIQVGGNGTDFWVTPTEVFRYKQILDAAWGATGTLSDTSPSNDFISLNLNAHIFDLRNIVTVIGTVQIPTDGDIWTESSDVWTNEASTEHSFEQDPNGNPIGTNALQIRSTPASFTGTYGVFTSFSPALNFKRLGSSLYPPRLRFSYRRLDPAVTDIKVILETSAGNFFEHTFTTQAGSTFRSKTLTLGPFTGFDKDWNVTGTPDWGSIAKIYLRGVDNSAASNAPFNIDGLVFSGNVAETAVDARAGKGEVQFGRREVTLFDSTPREISIPTSTAGGPGIRQVAKMELFKWADPITSGYIDFDVTSDNASTILLLKPGYKIPITSAHYNFTAKNFRVLRVRHRWRKGDDFISVAAEITNFVTNTLSRQPGDLFRELMPYDAVSRGAYEQMKFQGLLASGGLTTTKFKYTSLSDPGTEI